MDIKRLKSTDDNFLSELKSLLNFDAADNEEIIKTTNDIINEVKKNGDQAVLDYTKKFDRVSTSSLKSLEIEQDELTESLNRIPKETKKFLEIAAARIIDYHLKQNAWIGYHPNKNLSIFFGQKISPFNNLSMCLGAKPHTHLQF